MEKRKAFKVKKEPAWKRLIKNLALTFGIGVGVSSCGGMNDKAENLSVNDMKMKKYSLQMKQNKNAMEVLELGSLDAKIKVQEFDEATRSFLERTAKDYIKKADEYLKKGADLGYYTEAVKALLPQGNYLILSEDGKTEAFVQSAQGQVQIGDNKFKSFTTDKIDPDEISYVMNMVATQYDLNSTEGRKYVNAITAVRAIEIAKDKALNLDEGYNTGKTYGSKGDDMSDAKSAYLAAYRYINESGSGRPQILEIVEEDVSIEVTPVMKVKPRDDGKGFETVYEKPTPKKNNRLASRDR